MNDKIKILALFGKSGTGKDHIKKHILLNFDMHNIISCTTRPKRQYETNGYDYHFLTDYEFSKKVLDGTMLEATSFNNWFYGTTIESLNKDKINIGIFNIQAIEVLLEDPRLHIIPILISSGKKTRLLRNLQREERPNCEEICRRFLADEKDFLNIPFRYKIFQNLDSSEDYKHSIKDVNWTEMFNIE